MYPLFSIYHLQRFKWSISGEIVYHHNHIDLLWNVWFTAYPLKYNTRILETENYMCTVHYRRE